MLGLPDFAKLVLEGARERERESQSQRERHGDKMINGDVLPVGLHVLAQTGLWQEFKIETELTEEMVTQEHLTHNERGDLRDKQVIVT